MAVKLRVAPAAGPERIAAGRFSASWPCRRPPAGGRGSPGASRLMRPGVADGHGSW